MMTRGRPVLAAALALLGSLAPGPGLPAESAPREPVRVTVATFPRAETDMYFAIKVEQAGGVGKFSHERAPVAIDRQNVIRMNRDTLYSAAVFDLDAAPVTVTLPDTGGRFLSAMVLNQDHYALDVAYAPSTLTLTRASVGTRYAAVILRTFINANDPADIRAANRLQDAVTAQQARAGAFEIPSWDPVTQKQAREALLQLAALGGTADNRFGKPAEVDPIAWLIGTAGGWGGNPLSAAKYLPVFPAQNDGRTAHVLTVKDVPVDAFWSITVYNAGGFMFENARQAYSLNSVTAKPGPDGAYTVRFGGDPAQPNFLAIEPGWNYVVRLYRPRAAILDGTWVFPEARPVR